MKLCINLLTGITILSCTTSFGAQMDPFLIELGQIRKKELTNSMLAPSRALNEAVNQLVAYTIGQWITVLEKAETHLPPKAAYQHTIIMCKASSKQSCVHQSSSPKTSSSPLTSPTASNSKLPQQISTNANANAASSQNK